MTIPNRLLPQSVAVAPLVGSGAYGDVFGPAVPVRARVDMTRKMVRNSKGVEVVAEATVFLPARTVCPPRSLVTLPGETTGRRVITFSPVIGARTEHHVEVTV